MGEAEDVRGEDVKEEYLISPTTSSSHKNFHSQCVTNIEESQAFSSWSNVG